MIKAVIFDIGGVLTSQETFNKAFDQVVQDSFTVVPNDSRYQRALDELFPKLERGEISGEEFWERLALALGQPYSAKLDTFFTGYGRKIRFYPQMLEIVARLKEKGVKTAVLSNIWKELSEINEMRHFYDRFDYRILSYEVRIRKPDKAIFLYALNLMDVKPEETLFIDDTEEYTNTARHLGMNTIHFKTIPQITDDLSHYGLL